MDMELCGIGQQHCSPCIPVWFGFTCPPSPLPFFRRPYVFPCLVPRVLLVLFLAHAKLAALGRVWEWRKTALLLRGLLAQAAHSTFGSMSLPFVTRQFQAMKNGALLYMRPIHGWFGGFPPCATPFGRPYLERSCTGSPHSAAVGLATTHQQWAEPLQETFYKNHIRRFWGPLFLLA